jgi:hypothetical protein
MHSASPLPPILLFPCRYLYVIRRLLLQSCAMDTTTIIRIVAGILFLLCIPIYVIPYWKTFSKAGFSGWLSLLILVPLVNLVVLYVVAFSEWKAKPKTYNVGS